jgi:hypothetical protein
VWILLAGVLPFAGAVASLEYFPSRYEFPQAWPILLVIGCAAGIPCVGLPVKLSRAAVIAAAFAAMLLQSKAILTRPEMALHETDADEFLSANPYSGSGVAEAIGLLRNECKSQPITILTDPWWGPPTDAIFAYLNQVRGTRVFEAWWMQMHGKYKLVPPGAMPVWKSQYERVADGEVDFSATHRLYYVTDTNHNTPADVHDEAPQARLLHRFAKRGGVEFIDVYWLQ